MVTQRRDLVTDRCQEELIELTETLNLLPRHAQGRVVTERVSAPVLEDSGRARVLEQFGGITVEGDESHQVLGGGQAGQVAGSTGPAPRARRDPQFRSGGHGRASAQHRIDDRGVGLAVHRHVLPGQGQLAHDAARFSAYSEQNHHRRE